METRKLGWTDFNLSTVGLGTFAFGDRDWQGSWGKQDDNDSIATVLAAVDSGINWLDTAPIYGVGHSEEVVGMALKKLAKKPIVSTKCGLFADNEGRVINRIKGNSIKAEVDVSLKRLGIDIIDLYHVHWPVPDEDIEEAWTAISEIIKAGKVRYAAASNFSVSQLKRIQPIHPISALQVAYSMIDRGIENELLPYCKQNSIGVVAWGPIAHGLLSGKFSRERIKNLDPKDNFRRNIASCFQEPELSLNLDLAEGLLTIAEGNGLSLAQLAIAWVLRRPEVTSAIVGARRPAQIRETAATGNHELSPQTITAIDRLLNEREKAR
ncbi:aldo/keto reductase [Chloroflexota bacterium]